MGYETSPLQLATFGIGFALLVLAPLYLLAVLAGLMAVFRHQRPRLGAALIVSALLPVALFFALGAAIESGRDIGSSTGLAARTVDGLHVVLVAAPLLLVVYGALAVSGVIARHIKGSAHA